MVFTFYKADIDLIPDTLDSPPSLPKVTLSNSGYDPKTKNKQKVKKNSAMPQGQQEKLHSNINFETKTSNESIICKFRYILY